jgi:hypothetical protein
MASLDTETERQARYATSQSMLSDESDDLYVSNGARRYNLSGGRTPTSSALGGMDVAAAVVGAIMVLAPLSVAAMGW